MDREPVDKGQLFYGLPTKADLQTMLSTIEENHRRELDEARGELQQKAHKVESSAVLANLTQSVQRMLLLDEPIPTYLKPRAKRFVIDLPEPLTCDLDLHEDF